jgi:hypothetical protein
MHDRSSDAVRIALLGGDVKLHGLVETMRRRGREASLAAKQAALQSLVDGRAAAELGRRRGEPKRASQVGRVSRWACRRCGSVESNDFSYSGSYERGVTFEEGSVKIRIPRIRCRCGGSVPPDFGVVLPKRKRLWYDVELDVIERYVSGASYRSIRDSYQHRGVYIGLSGLPAMVGQCWQVGLRG